MRVLVLLLALTACADRLHWTAADPPPPGTCTRQAKLGKPPPPGRTLTQLTAWADHAAMVANAAIDERDLCVGSYDRLLAWVHRHE